ncbi:MAG: pantetheine-phosphate adenylyltransferase [Dehalococcoidales bacterium]
MTVAVYPGTFDPITNGHLDIAKRAAGLFEKLIIGVYDLPDKRILFNTGERIDLLRRSVDDLPNVEVTAFSGMTVDFAIRVGAKTLVRGLRMSRDFEREFEMALMNNNLRPELELVCLMTRGEYQFLSSSLLKEVAELGGDIDSLVPEHVAEALKKKLAARD